MTTMSQFDRIYDRLPELLDELGAPSLPDYTDDLLVRTSATRQRPRWTFLERWLPMGVIARDRIYMPRMPWRLIAVAALLVVTLVAVLLAVGSRKPLPPPFGPAANGAFVFDQEGDIYLRTAPSAEPRLIVGGDAEDVAPGFSRDGTRLTFVRMEQHGTIRKPDVVSIYSVDLDGSDMRVVVGGLSGLSGFDWSPDNRQLVAEIKVEGVAKVHMIDVETGAVRDLGIDFPSFVPQWRGPDGREIIFRGYTRVDEGVRAFIWSVRPDGSNLHPLTAPGDDYFTDYENPAVSPDGRYVAYNAFDDDGNWRIYLLEIDTRETRVLQLGPAGGHQGYPAFSPDGSRLLFHWISADDLVQVMVAPIDGSSPAVPIGPNSPVVGDTAQLQQAFSPDGKSVIFNRGHDRQSRLVDVITGGMGELLPWDVESVPSWQRLAFPE